MNISKSVIGFLFIALIWLLHRKSELLVNTKLIMQSVRDAFSSDKEIGAPIHPLAFSSQRADNFMIRFQLDPGLPLHDIADDMQQHFSCLKQITG